MFRNFNICGDFFSSSKQFIHNATRSLYSEFANVVLLLGPYIMKTVEKDLNIIQTVPKQLWMTYKSPNQDNLFASMYSKRKSLDRQNKSIKEACPRKKVSQD